MPKLGHRLRTRRVTTAEIVGVNRAGRHRELVAQLAHHARSGSTLQRALLSKGKGGGCIKLKGRVGKCRETKKKKKGSRNSRTMREAEARWRDRSCGMEERKRGVGEEKGKRL